MESSIRPAAETTGVSWTGSRDGAGAGDHDQPFNFGHRPNSGWTYPFTAIQLAHLMVLRGRLQDGEFSDDRRKR